MSSPRTIPFARPWITAQDRDAVVAVLDSPILTHGPQGQAFEEEFSAFLGPGAHAVAVSSCMAALHMAYLAHGIGPGDEVVAPAMTHTATAHAIEWVGARPVFVDCDAATGNAPPDAIAAAITERTRAIALVHFVGIPCRMDPIMEIAGRRGLVVIEDCAIALGARHKGAHVGLLGDAGCFSFYPAKHITTGEGGMFVTRHAEVAARVGQLRAFGVDRGFAERTIPGLYDVPTLGLNYRLSEMPAALGRSQLARVEENLARRRTNFGKLKQHLEALPDARALDATDADAPNSPYCLSLVLEGDLAGRRNEIAGRLNAAGIGTSIYYPQPVPRLSYYRAKYGYDAGRFPNAVKISDQSLALPVGPHLGATDIDYLAETLSAVWKEL
jgi:dTDP-4-amino-4,6-dideoxygalactose transaminase